MICSENNIILEFLSIYVKGFFRHLLNSIKKGSKNDSLTFLHLYFLNQNHIIKILILNIN
jgi:hypothetical protein